MKKILKFGLLVILVISACSTGNKYSKFEKQLSEQKARIDSLQNVANQMNTEITKLQNSHSTKLNNLNNRVGAMENLSLKISRINSRISSLENRLERQKKSIYELFDTTLTRTRTESQNVTPPKCQRTL